MMILVKEVNMINIDGANVIIVNRRIISSVTTRSSGFSTRPIPSSNDGNGIWGSADGAVMQKITNITRIMVGAFIFLDKLKTPSFIHRIYPVFSFDLQIFFD